MKNAFLFLLVTFGIVFNGTADEVWKQVKTPNEIIGVWDGFKNLPIEATESTPATLVKVNLSLTYADGTDVFINVKMDFNQFLDDFIEMLGMNSSEEVKKFLWLMISSEFAKDDTTEFFLSTENYYIEMQTETDVFELISSDIYVNNKKTQLKFLLNSFPMMGIDENEFILYKQ
jgi:hypothetical protein